MEENNLQGICSELQLELAWRASLGQRWRRRRQAAPPLENSTTTPPQLQRSWTMQAQPLQDHLEEEETEALLLASTAGQGSSSSSILEIQEVADKASDFICPILRCLRPPRKLPHLHVDGEGLVASRVASSRRRLKEHHKGKNKHIGINMKGKPRSTLYTPRAASPSPPAGKATGERAGARRALTWDSQT